MTHFEKIRYETGGGIARIVLNRPEKRNALDAEVISNLKDALKAAEEEAAVRVVSISGAGKDFCAGADLEALQESFENGPLENMSEARELSGLFLAMRRHRCPIVALVKGRALAGGCGLAGACDLILAAESAQFGYPEVNIGFVPAMVTALLRRAVPEKRAFEWLIGGERFPASAAHSAGLVNRLFPDAEFDAEAAKYLDRLAAKPAPAATLAKRLFYHTDSMSLEAALEAGVETNALARMTEDCRAGVGKFLKK